jgi:carbonic anhydrase
MVRFCLQAIKHILYFGYVTLLERKDIEMDNSFIEEILEFNNHFVEDRSYVSNETTSFPDKKVAILTCVDARLDELIPAALGLKSENVQLIRNAGAVLSHPFGSVMRSLLIEVYDLWASEILVIGHKDCGMESLDAVEMVDKMKGRGITDIEFELVENCGGDVKDWLHGFESIEESIKETVWTIQDHPLVPKDIEVAGFIIDPETGKLERVDTDEQL